MLNETMGWEDTSVLGDAPESVPQGGPYKSGSNILGNNSHPDDKEENQGDPDWENIVDGIKEPGHFTIEVDDSENTEPIQSNLESFLTPFESLIPSEDNTVFQMADITELAESIRVFGLLQPLNVIHAGDGTYIINQGHRRYEAIKLLRERGYNIFPDGIMCVSSKTKIGDLDATIQLYEGNIHNRNLSKEESFRSIRELYYLYQKRVETNPSFAKCKLIELLEQKLGIAKRQARKYFDLIDTPASDSWLQNAFLKGDIPVDRASIIAHLDDNSKLALKEIYERDGKIPDKVLDTFRKKKGSNELTAPGSDGGTDGPAGPSRESSIPMGKDANQEQTSPVPDDKQNTPGKAARDSKGAFDPKGFMDNSLSEDLDMENEYLAQVGKYSESMSPEEYDPDYAGSFDGENEYIGNLDEIGDDLSGFMPAPEFQAKVKNDVPIWKEDMNGGTCSNIDDPSSALLWFTHIDDRGKMTLDEKVIIDSMVKLLSKFYFSDVEEKGYIDAEMQPYMLRIQEVLNKVLRDVE